uniref:CSON004306 protein n=1 Tax=Culicoides sonorensis TaxID=179676 RepID=A0A336LY79_CULSO
MDEIVDCVNVVCPALQEITCPDDSYPHTVFPSHMLEAFVSTKNNANNNNNVNEEDIHKLSYHADTDDDNLSSGTIRKILEKRSILFERRESIKIVPGGHHFFGHIHKRSLSQGNNKYDYRLDKSSSGEIIASTSESSATNLHASMIVSDEKSTKRCCEYHECKCFPAHESNCKIPHCTKPLIKAVKRHASGLPGDCCDDYECIAPNYCESRLTGKRYPVGATWDEQDCQTCRCDQGETKCQMYFCKPLSCQKRILVPGACCQTCDDTATDFCTSEINCNIHCPNGFQKSDEGCNLCKCAYNIIQKIDINYTSDSIKSTDVENSLIDNHTVTLTNIQSICENQFQKNMYIFISIIITLLLVIIVIVLYLIVQKRQKNSQSYKPVANIDSNFNSLPPSCTLKGMQQYEGI